MHCRRRPLRALTCVAVAISGVFLFADRGLQAQVAEPWISLDTPDEWSRVAYLAGMEEPPALPVQIRDRIAVRGQAFHPSGIKEILVGGRTAMLERSGADLTLAFSALVRPSGEREIIIEVRPFQGEVFVRRFPVQYGTNIDLTRYSEPWINPDSLLLLIGTDQTIPLRLSVPPQEGLEAKYLDWSTSNAAVVSVDSSGLVHPVTPGSAAIMVAFVDKRINIPVRVFQRPSGIVFSPADSVLDIVVGQRFIPRADLQMVEGQVVRGVIPNLTEPDTIVLRPESHGTFVALRPGEVRLTGRLGSEERRWLVRVRPPGVRIVQSYGSLLIGEPRELRAAKIAGGGLVLGAADGVSWQSPDSDVISLQGSTVTGRTVGRAKLLASQATESDTATIFVLGDLLAGIEDEHGEERIATISVRNRALIRIGSDSVRGSAPALSPDGRTIAFAGRIERRQPRIFLMDPDGRNIRRLVQDDGSAFRTSSYEEHTPRWSSDGQRIVFVTNRPGNYEIYSVRVNGTDLQRLSNDGAVDWHVSTAPDVPRIAFERVVGAGDGDLIVALLDGTGESVFRVPTTTPYIRTREAKPALLPGGNQLVFARGAENLDEATGEALSLMDLTTGTVKRDLVPAAKDHEMIFAVSPDGQRIAYHQRARWGKKNGNITVIDLTGKVVASVTLTGARDIREISWGAFPQPLSPG